MFRTAQPEPAMPIAAEDIVPLNKVRASLTALAEEVRNGHEKIITRNGESYVALVDARQLDYYHKLEREVQQLNLMQDVIEGLKRVRAGEPGAKPEDAKRRLQRKLDAARPGK
jgi:antitoxin (DNA-binding transcriptional repressor) of toxin-antitoxin stability system